MEDEQPRSTSKARSTEISTLPGELLSKILTFAVANDAPVYFWLFPNLNFEFDEWKYYVKKVQSGSLRIPRNQREHHRDWLGMTMTSRRFRQYGLPAFFREKTFIVPANMLRPYTAGTGTKRSKGLFLAKESIRHIIVTCRIDNSVDFPSLKDCHELRSLASMTIWAPQTHDKLLYGLDYSELWPTDMPEEFLDLLKKTGVRVNDIEVKLVIRARFEGMVESQMDRIRDVTYTQLRAWLR